ncbi:WD and tetratricopeptide repeats protein 1 [Eumeta japonica]|uniref:WD and tetratricopeptide repeats protein 1 n=1 Tax=Eumeta variegata TaxID=151549 RepID=A0A4C1VLY1_EUMVA|nr:WD and tetratricopeptide repeats protein 1 [Eumeta japonica]
MYIKWACSTDKTSLAEYRREITAFAVAFYLVTKSSGGPLSLHHPFSFQSPQSPFYYPTSAIIVPLPSSVYCFLKGWATHWQHDLRTPHTCDSDSPNVLVNLLNHLGRYAEAKCVAVNPRRPEQLAVGANDFYARLYDTRMIRLSSVHVGSVGGSDTSSARLMWERQHVRCTRAGHGDPDNNIPRAAVQYFAPDKVDAILEKVEQDRHINSYDLTEELGIDHKTVLIHLKKAQNLDPTLTLIERTKSNKLCTHLRFSIET